MSTRSRVKRPTLLAALAAALIATPVLAQEGPRFENPSPTAGGDTSQKANETADKAMYKPVEYVNKGKPGPALVVIPGEVKSNNASFVQKYGPNNIADFAEFELSNANFKVLERANLGSLLQEFQIAYNLGDPRAARKMLQKGKLKTTKWVVKFDILKAEQVSQAQQGFDGRPVGALLGIFGGGRGGAAGSVVASSVQTGESTGVWVIGMRYKIIDANTTEQVAQGYSEEKMELGAKSSSVMGFSGGERGGLTLDSMVQRLIQKTVWEMDKNYK